MRGFDGSIAPVSVAAKLPPAWDGGTPASPDPFPDAAIIAFISFSVIPARCNAIRPLVEVSNFPGCDWIALTMTDSGSWLLTMLIMSAFVRGRSGFCPWSVATNVADSNNHVARILDVFMLISFFRAQCLPDKTADDCYLCDSFRALAGRSADQCHAAQSPTPSMRSRSESSFDSFAVPGERLR